MADRGVMRQGLCLHSLQKTEIRSRSDIIILRIENFDHFKGVGIAIGNAYDRRYFPKMSFFRRRVSSVETGSLNTNWTRILFLAILAINFRIERYVPTHEILTHNFHRHNH